jgi:putative transposase
MGHPGKSIRHMGAPNVVWSAECTGKGNTGDGLYGDPLAVADGDSRVLLGCQARASPRVGEAQPVFTRLFKAFGLPQRIRTDNGVPLATKTLGRLSHLSAGWVRLGSFPECIEPGTPQQHAAMSAGTVRCNLPWRLHRPRGNRRGHLDRRFRAAETRPAARTTHAHRRC